MAVCAMGEHCFWANHSVLLASSEQVRSQSLNSFLSGLSRGHEPAGDDGTSTFEVALRTEPGRTTHLQRWNDTVLALNLDQKPAIALRRDTC